MITFDFQGYHTRSINARSLEERMAINQELKALYASLSPEEQKVFNEGLEAYMKQQKEQYQSLMQGLN